MTISTHLPPHLDHRSRRLADRLAAGTPFALVFGGQGAAWLPPLAELVRTHAVDLAPVLDEADRLLAPVRADLVRLDAGFTPLPWIDAVLAEGSEGESVEIEGSRVPEGERLLEPSRSVPGILLTQVAAIRALRGLGIDPSAASGLAGHSQGVFAAAIVDGRPEGEALAIARLAGAAAQQVARRQGLLGEAMLAVPLDVRTVAERLVTLPPAARVEIGLRNGPRSTVLTGPAEGIAAAADLFDDVAVEPVLSGAAFHHPDLAEAADVAAAWAERCGLDPVLVRTEVRAALVDEVDWMDTLGAALDSASQGGGARWLLDLGPSDLAARIATPEARRRGIGVVAPATPAGLRELTVAGASPRAPRPWTSFAPSVVTLPDGTVRAETRFTRLTGRSPILLAGMTPTTVDPAIVAAAANAGYWAELAGGGQVTEPIFDANLQRLGDLLDPGRTWAFNSLFLDPYLWRLQLGSQRLVQKARTVGAAVDSVVVTAGIPELDEAVALVEELRGLGIEYVVFKPGTVAQIRQVLKIADAVAPQPLIVQIEGGQAGGHHSEEDLDELLLASYADLRRRDNVVVVVGGGVGTPDVAVRYLTGAWALEHQHPAMPLDGVLVGTAAMACLEATTSPQVKQLLVDTTPDQVISGRSQLGAALHEIDNTSARTGVLLDEVAGDADAVRARHDEIVEALAATAKPWFGALDALTYGAWLERFAALCIADGTWGDVTWRDRFHALVQRAEARLHPRDRGPIATLFPGSDDVDEATAALATLRAAYPGADTVLLHPADAKWFVEVCRRAGKPVPFVPVIDADVRRWWRSDSLWQAHDARFDADAVSIIPGPVSVAGITRVDEPIAELLGRFEDALTDELLAGGLAPRQVAGLRRTERATGPVSLVLAAPDASWAGRTVVNPVRRLGDDWVLVADDRAENAATGASLTADGPDRARLTVPLEGSDLVLHLTAGAEVAAGAAPVVVDAPDAMRTLARLAGGDVVPSASWDPALGADHAGVTGATGGRLNVVPDALVGLAWPAVFAALAEREDVISGLLDLVHLDHTVAGPVPAVAETFDVRALVRDVTDTEVGRTVTVDVTLSGREHEVALVERFALRGQTGPVSLEAPARAGGLGAGATDTPRKRRASATLTAPFDAAAFAQVTGDHNPIHTSLAASRLAGLGGTIVHGMWISAAAQRVVVQETARTLIGWTARFVAPVRPGDRVAFVAERVGLVDGDEIVEVTARVEGETVLVATGRLEAPRTAYAFPGQGIQRPGMGMEGYARSKAAREIWDRADAHTREVLGFSILSVVRDNPTELTAPDAHGDVVVHRHPDGVLFLTQFTQVAMAVLAAAQTAELRESGAFVEGSVLAGHSVGEYNALAAVSGALSLEAVVEVVFQRGSVMHTLVPRDADGRSDYRLAAIRPAQFDVADDDVRAFVEGIAAETGEFLEIANYNLRGSQYAIAGTVRGVKALEDEVERRRAAVNGRAAFVLVPGIDVPFHSAVLRGGVDDFRAKLDQLLPAEIDPTPLVGRYVPNLVARPFALDRPFIASVLEVAPSRRVEEILADLDAWTDRPGALCREVLIELLAWQFASPVRWIETQDLMFAARESGGLGVQRFVEIGVGSAPTVANLASSTLKLPAVRRTLGDPVEVLNVERDAKAVFAQDESVHAEQTDELAGEAPAESSVAASAPPSTPALAPPSTGARPDDLAFGAGDATRLLLAWWTRMRPDQIGASDSIESLTDGASSRRNQLLMDLGAELGLGAIDGAAEADVPTLTGQVTTLARGYRPLGPVLTTTVADHLTKVLGPTGVRQPAVAERVTGTWQLGPGWATHVLVELAAGTRSGASVRGGDLATIDVPTTSAEVEAAVDVAVRAVAARHGVDVSLPDSGGGATVDATALAELTGGITDALVSTARHLLDQLEPEAWTPEPEPVHAEREVLERVETELGRDWISATAPAFDARRAVLFDDRWASAREDVVRLARGETVTSVLDGAGQIVAAQARWQGLEDVAARAEDMTPGRWADEVAVVTGAGRGSIAGALVAQLLGGGATVVATTSRLDGEKLAWFRELYRSTARAGAKLWVVPANLASYADVDALVAWVTEEQHRRVGPTSERTKPALQPTLLFPFAAGRVIGDAAAAGSRAEIEARILLWSVERLAAADWSLAPGRRLHVVLPGSPNRGRFGGDGAYGETKAALDALTMRWHAERAWADRVTLAHPIIGWVRGTGLMGGNDPLVEAVEAAGVRTWSPEEMAEALLDLCTAEARETAAETPLSADFAGGLEKVDLRSLDVERPEPEASVEADTIDALPPSPAVLPQEEALAWGDVPARPEDLVVLVGAGELGPWGSSRTRYEAEVDGALSAAGVLELAWLTGLVQWDDAKAHWFDVASGDEVPESEIHERYHDEVVARCGIRDYADEGTMVDHTAPLLAAVHLEQDLTFTVGSEADARAMLAADPAGTRIAPAADGGWSVTRRAGTQIRVPRRLEITRTAGGQLPTGFDPTVWGVPAEMVESVDRVALWNLVCTVDAFLSSGFSPAELMRWVHPARVANTQGTGMGGMTSMQSLYLDTLLGESVANDLLQEALPNVIAAHVMQSYVGGYGAMIHPVAACATTAVSVEEGVDKIRVGKADVVVAGGFDDLGTEGVIGFAAMSATADTAAMTAQGIDLRHLSRANDRRRGGFVESQGGGTLLLARGDVAARLGLPVLAVVAYAGSFADGVHTSIPAPGLGALAAGLGGRDSQLARGLATVGLDADDVAVVSKHDTSTAANDPNESELHERLAEALGRSEGNPLLVVSQKSLTGHAKGGAAAFQLIGLSQVLARGVVPPNRSLDCVDDALAEHPHLVWLREPLATGPLKAGLVTSLGFGHVAGLVALVHPEAFVQSLPAQERDSYRERARARRIVGQLRLATAMLGDAAYVRPKGRRLGDGAHTRDLEASVLLTPEARLGDDGVYACS